MIDQYESQDQFESRYGKQLFESGYKIALRCNCDEFPFEHWAAVPNNPECIADHEQFYQVSQEMAADEASETRGTE